MQEILDWLFDSASFTPRSMCGPGWTPSMVFLATAFENAIFAAYVLIPIFIVTGLRRRQRLKHDVPRAAKLAGALFALFILSCAATHKASEQMFYTPWYRLDVLILGLCAALSWTTVVLLPGVTSDLVTTPSVLELRAEIDRRARAEEELTHANDVLRARLEEAKRLREAIDRMPTTQVMSALDRLIARMEPQKPNEGDPHG